MTTIDVIAFFFLFQNGQRNKQAMINLIDYVHVSKAILLSTGASDLKFGEDLRITKTDNGPIFLTQLGVRKSVVNETLENFRQFFIS